MIAPVRPVLKSRYPLTPMKNFARWTREDGLHIDPWIRTHQKDRGTYAETNLWMRHLDLPDRR